jgi:hypothetical protein
MVKQRLLCVFLATITIIISSHGTASFVQVLPNQSLSRISGCNKRVFLSSHSLKEISQDVATCDMDLKIASFELHPDRVPILESPHPDKETTKLNNIYGHLKQGGSLQVICIFATLILLAIPSAASAEIHPVDHVSLGIPMFVPDVRYFLAGGMCAAVSHGVTTPIDVVKTRIQADPQTLGGKGVLGAAQMILENDGPSVLLGGLGPTVLGYGLEGATKFGLYESLKPTFATLLYSIVGNNPTLPYLGASVFAGGVASLVLCPLEKSRIRQVTDPSFSDCGLFEGLSRMAEKDGLPSLFGGIEAMLSKQIPYTLCKQVSFDVFAKTFYAAAASISLSPDSGRVFRQTRGRKRWPRVSFDEYAFKYITNPHASAESHSGNRTAVNGEYTDLRRV